MCLPTEKLDFDSNHNTEPHAQKERETSKRQQLTLASKWASQMAENVAENLVCGLQNTWGGAFARSVCLKQCTVAQLSRPTSCRQTKVKPFLRKAKKNTRATGHKHQRQLDKGIREAKRCTPVGVIEILKYVCGSLRNSS